MDVKFYLKQAQDLKAKLDEFRPFSPKLEAKIMQKLRLDWNFHSNHLEGNQLTYGETKALILHGLTAQGKPIKDHLETSGHDEAIFMVEDIVKNNHPLTEHFIRELHVLILKEPDYKRSISADGKNVMARKINIGVYKTSPNHVKTATGETFYFASPEETPAKMQELIDWYRQQKENQEVNPILFASQFHYKFIRIHPFDDGNGRIARLLMNFILMQFGYPPAVIKTQDKENYFSALRQADAGNVESFISYITENVIYTLELMLKGANGENIEEPDDFDKQIALLENKLKEKNGVVQVKRSLDILDSFYENLHPLVYKFIQINNNFNKFYNNYRYGYRNPKENIWRLFPSFNEKNYSTILKGVLKLMLQDKFEFVTCLHCTHTEFIDFSIENFNYQFEVRLDFLESYYKITFPKSNQTISKLYHQKLTDEEIDYFLKKEAQKHLDFIQEKMNAKPAK